VNKQDNPQDGRQAGEMKQKQRKLLPQPQGV